MSYEQFETTTNLDVIRYDLKRFTWGKVVHIHDLCFEPHAIEAPRVARYTFVEFIPKTSDGKSMAFLVYVDGRDTGRSSHSLEGAMLVAIAHKMAPAGPPDHMALACAKLLSVEW